MCPCILIVCSTSLCTLSKSRVSTVIADACPLASLISRSTVLIVDCWEFGSGGNGVVAYASLVDFAATTTKIHQLELLYQITSRVYLHIRSLPDQLRLAADPSRSTHHEGYLVSVGNHVVFFVQVTSNAVR